MWHSRSITNFLPSAAREDPMNLRISPNIFWGVVRSLLYASAYTTSSQRVTCVSLDFDNTRNTIELRANPLQNPSLSPAQPLTKPKPWAGEAERSSTARTRCTCCRCSRIFPSHLPRPHASQPPSPSVQTSHPLPLCKPAANAMMVCCCSVLCIAS